MSDTSTQPWKRKLTARALAGRYGITLRTLDRWVKAGAVPPPIYVNTRRYFDEQEVEQRDRERAAAGNGAAA